MRLILASILLCVLLSACSKPVARLQAGGALTGAELTHLSEIHPLLTNWAPSYSGVYAHSGVTQQVYLRDHGVGGTVSGTRGDLLVFDSNGRLVDAGIFRLRGARAPSLLGLSPLRLRLSHTDGDTEDIACEIPRDLAIKQFRKDMEDLADWIETKKRK